MEQAASISCSPLKAVKTREQSSLNYSLPARTCVPDFSRAGIAPVSYGLLLGLPVGTVSLGRFTAPTRGALAERIFFMPSFHVYLLQPETRAVLATMEIIEPTPIQAEAIPALLAGNDLVGQSATGSGKTLAYGIPLVERVARDKRVVQALVLVPTRELAIQVDSVLGKLASGRRLSTALLVGGRPYGKQLAELRYGAQMVIGTPGRVKDHLDRGTFALDELRVCVLDEADQMLDSGFAPAIEEILTTTPDTRQTALFSATMPDWIVTLQQKFLNHPVTVSISPATDVQSTIEQIAYQVPQEQKLAATSTLLHATEGDSSLIFGRTKFGGEKLGKQLSKLGFTVGTLHGNKSQRAREAGLSAFLSWLLHPSVREMDDLIASLLLCFDNRIQNAARIFPPMAVLAILAAKQSHHETYSVIFLPLIWENRQGSTACWQAKLYHALKASAKALTAHLRHALLRMSGGSQALLQ